MRSAESVAADGAAVNAGPAALKTRFMVVSRAFLGNVGRFP